MNKTWSMLHLKALLLNDCIWFDSFRLLFDFFWWLSSMISTSICAIYDCYDTVIAIQSSEVGICWMCLCHKINNSVCILLEEYILVNPRFLTVQPTIQTTDRTVEICLLWHFNTPHTPQIGYESFPVDVIES